MRSKWIDKATGKVINLSNYAYSQMSGWNGYSFPSFKVTMEHSDRYVGTISNSVAHITDIIGNDSNNIVPLEWHKKNIENSPANQAFRISGIPDDIYIEFDYVENGSTGISTVLFSTKNGGDGIYEAKNVPPADFYRFRFYKKDNSNFTGHTNCNIFIEMLPLYPGALVSNGVDDVGSTAEILSEPIGSVLLHYRNLGLEPNDYVFYTGSSSDGDKRLYFYKGSSNSMSIGMPNKVDNDDFVSLARTPLAPDKTLKFEPGNHTAIFRLIFIKEQLDDTQLEFLTWKVSKEYRDWCKENGYEYTIDEMMNN